MNSLLNRLMKKLKKLAQTVTMLSVLSVLSALALLALLGCSSGGDDFISLKSKGLEYIGNEDYEKAEEKLLLALKKEPSDRETLFFLGISEMNLGKDSLAISNFRKVLKLYGPDSETARNLILVSLAAEDWESGLDGLRALVSCGTPLSELFLEFYEMYNNAGRIMSASRMLDSLIKQEPENPAYYLRAASLKSTLEMYPEAEMQLQEALRRFGPNMEVYSNMGVLEMTQEKYDRAEKYFRKAVEYGGTNDAPFLNLAQCLSVSDDRNKRQEAVSIYRKISQVNFDRLRLDTVVARLEFELGN